ncbi:MAG TPA: glycoside hydrolase family 2 TIM barrel-domain containing protein, partial [Armatimonadota bacterium]|nr:glycoside hydrolase family 2 TIM barrel-domain containing protein [Armatimonadota bacterium]
MAFRAELDESCTTANCTVQVNINGTTHAAVSITLAESESGRTVISTTIPAGEVASFTVTSPHLWSPERPDLYTLTVRLEGEAPDSVQEVVGFRRLEIRGQDFYLNNWRLVLRGVCRHEFTSRHGYCPTPEEVHRELAMIKHAGFNYVRLVHSPQAPIVPRLAAEIGLLVTEESGTCWHDLDNDVIAAPAL